MGQVHKSKRVAVAGAVIAAALAGLFPAACGANDPLNISCADFLTKSESEQLDLAALWAAPDRKNPGPEARMVAPRYRRDLLTYCPKHRKDKLKDLELRLSPG
jgi:hypothetical protein